MARIILFGGLLGGDGLSAIIMRETMRVMVRELILDVWAMLGFGGLALLFFLLLVTGKK